MMQALKDHSDKWSIKRILGMLLVAVCLVFAFIDMFTNYTANDFIFGTLFGGALALLGVETVVNGFSKNRTNQRQRGSGVNEEGDL